MFENPDLLSPEEVEALRQEILEALRLVEQQEQGYLLLDEYEVE